MTRLTMQVDAGDIALSSLLRHLPRVLELNLNGSILSGPRDLGSGLLNLRVLWMCRCSLPSLDGIASLSSLEELYASFNDIRELAPLAGESGSAQAVRATIGGGLGSNLAGVCVSCMRAARAGFMRVCGARLRIVGMKREAAIACRCRPGQACGPRPGGQWGCFDGGGRVPVAVSGTLDAQPGESLDKVSRSRSGAVA